MYGVRTRCSTGGTRRRFFSSDLLRHLQAIYLHSITEVLYLILCTLRFLLGSVPILLPPHDTVIRANTVRPYIHTYRCDADFVTSPDSIPFLLIHSMTDLILLLCRPAVQIKWLVVGCERKNRRVHFVTSSMDGSLPRGYRTEHCTVPYYCTILCYTAVFFCAGRNAPSLLDKVCWCRLSWERW